MCCGCYEEYGSPVVVSDKVHVARELRGYVYEFNLAGGNLHCLLDDFNIEDVFTTEDYIDEQEKAGECHPLQIAFERACARVFAAMSMDERATALGWECIPEDKRPDTKPSDPVRAAMASLHMNFGAWDMTAAVDDRTREDIGLSLADAEQGVIASLVVLGEVWRASL